LRYAHGFDERRGEGADGAVGNDCRRGGGRWIPVCQGETSEKMPCLETAKLSNPNESRTARDGEKNKICGNLRLAFFLSEGIMNGGEV
jgi:hypothetical protein